MKLVTNKFKSGGACSGNLESWEPSQQLLIDTRKPRKTCVEVAGRRTFRILTSSQQSGIESKNNTHIVQQIHIRWQQYTQDNYNNTHKTTTTTHTRHLKIQHVQKVNNPTVIKYCLQFSVFFPTYIVLTLSPQSFTCQHFTTHINFTHKVSFLPPFPTLHCTLLHFIS